MAEPIVAKALTRAVIGSETATNLSEMKRRSVRLSSGLLGGRKLCDDQLRLIKRKHQTSSFHVVARLFQPARFEASKLKVLFLGTHQEQHPAHLSRIYTLTHSDITANITLAISQTINDAQVKFRSRPEKFNFVLVKSKSVCVWIYSCNRLQRDEVIAQWKKSQGKMSLHVHCHISGDHWLRDGIAKLRFYIFRKELPVVLEAFRHGDRALLEKHPELEEALVWVYFHSNLKEFKRIDCWGTLAQACKGVPQAEDEDESDEKWEMRKHCPHPCDCCFPPFSLLLRPHNPQQLLDI